MGQQTGIEWTDATWNPIRGCSRVSEGCRNCYAERTAARFSRPGLPYEGLAEMVVIADSRGVGVHDARWSGEVRFIPELLDQPLHWKRPRKIFVNSMSDLFHEKLEIEWIDQIVSVMAVCPRHIFQVLTKRPGRMRNYFANNATKKRLIERIVGLTEGLSGCSLTIPGDNGDGLPGMSLPNVWLGVSVEDQKTADERIPLLLETPAAVRWVSYEPALGPVDFSRWLPRPDEDGNCTRCGLLIEPEELDIGHECPPGFGPALDWIVAGGESGPGARPAHPDWFRAARDQCAAAGVPFFFKQWGEWGPSNDHISTGRLRAFDGDTKTFRIGKKAAGRLLDGQEWNEFPCPSRT